MAIQSVVHSNAFNFVSFLQNGVDPRTGQYTLGIDLPELVGNDLSGPRLPLRLAFSPMNDQNAGFGLGWGLNLSQFALNNGILSLSSGESFKVADNGPGQEPVIAERKLESFHFHNDSDPGAGLVRYRVVHKSGLVEVLEPQPGEPTLALPVRLLAPSGHGLTLAYERKANQTRLVNVIDDSGRELLAIDYSSNNEVLIDLHPGQAATARYTLKSQAGELREIVLPTAEQASWRFQYVYLESVRCVSQVDNPLGGTERIYHRAQGHAFPPAADGRERWLPCVERHVVQPGAGQPDMETRYSFSTQNFLGYGSGIVWDNDGLDNLYRFAGSSYLYTSTTSYLLAGESVEPEPALLKTKRIVRRTTRRTIKRTVKRAGKRTLKRTVKRTLKRVVKCTVKSVAKRARTSTVVRTITRTFNRFHLLTEQVTQQGDCIAKVETAYHEVPGLRFEHQPNKFQLTKEQTSSWSLARRPTEYREQKVLTDHDAFGNLTDETQANGIRTLIDYYPATPGAGDNFPADPEGFVRHPRSRQVFPASNAEPGAKVLRTDYTYRLVAPVNAVGRGELLLEREALVQAADAVTLREVRLSYYEDTSDPLSHGRRRHEERVLGGHTTQVDYAYSRYDEASHPALRTVETLTGFDHGQPDEQGGTRNTKKTVTLLQSVLIDQPLLNRDDNDVEIAYEYDSLQRVTRETVAPKDPLYEASRVYTYELTSAVGQQARQTRVDVKGVTTWSYVDGLGREVREDRQDSDFGMTAAARTLPRPSYTVQYDGLGNRIEETEFDWYERDQRSLVTRFDYDDWGEQCCVTGPDGVRNHEQREMAGSAQWRAGTVLTQWRESADGTMRTGTTVTRSNAFDEPAQVERFDAAGNAYSLHRYYHDGLGRVAREVDARGQQVKFDRDGFDRLVDHTLANGALVHRDYAAHSSEDLPTSIKVVHQDGRPESLLGEQVFDGLDRMVVSITGGRRRLMAYDTGQRQPRQVITPSQQHIQYKYTPVLGEEPVARHLLESNLNASYEYDPHNARLGFCREQAEVDGRAVDPEQVQALGRTYFSTGELRSETRTQGTETFEMVYVHSLRGRLLAYTDVLGQLQSYTYDDFGRLQVTQLGTTRATFDYDALGRMRQIDTLDNGTQVPNRLITELEYDDFERETLRRFIFSSGEQQELRQDYNVVDGIIRKELTSQAANAAHNELLREEHFEYDARARLEYYESAGPLSPEDPSGVIIEAQEFYLDDLDNIEEVRTWHADGRVDALYRFDNPLDPAQLTGVEIIRRRKRVPGEAFERGREPRLEEVSRQMTELRYDDDGNMTLDDAGRSLEYDALGRLVSVKLPEQAEAGTYGYDPLDRLALQTGG